MEKASARGGEKSEEDKHTSPRRIGCPQISNPCKVCLLKLCRLVDDLLNVRANCHRSSSRKVLANVDDDSEEDAHSDEDDEKSGEIGESNEEVGGDKEGETEAVDVDINHVSCNTAAAFHTGLLVDDYVHENPTDFAHLTGDDNKARAEGAAGLVSVKTLKLQHEHGMTYIFFKAAPPVALAIDSSDIVCGDTESTAGAGEQQSEIASPAAITSTTHTDGHPASSTGVQSTLSPSTSAVAIAMGGLPTGRFGRKRKIVQIHGLSDCECGLQADPNAEDVVQCK